MTLKSERLGSKSSVRSDVSNAMSVVILSAVLLLTAISANAGQNDGALNSNGLLTFETGATDRFGHYRVGNLTTVPDISQPVFDEDKNKCELDQSAGGPLVLLAQENGQNVGFVGDSMGVFSRGGGGSARGVKCGRINDDERLTFLVQSFDADGDGEADGNAVIRSRIDVEFKQSPIVIFTTGFAGQTTGQFWLGTGENDGVAPTGLIEDAVELEGCGDLSGTDNNNDSGPSDNCHIEFEALWTSMTVEVQGGGQISIEGGGDYADAIANRSEFELVRADGILDCQQGFVGDDDRIDGARLANVDGGCEALVPFSIEYDGDDVQLLFETGGQDTTWVVNTEWQSELQLAAAQQEPTLVSWDDGEIDWADCADPADGSDPTCFALADCDVGEPVRFCSDTIDNPGGPTSCSIDDDCGPSEGSCELTNIEAPEGGFPDVDPNRDGDQFSCVCEQTETWLGTRGRDNIAGTDDDTAPDDYTLVQQCIFLEGDIRWNR